MFKKIGYVVVERCEEIPSILDGQLLRADGQGEGARAYFLCNDLYFPTALYGVCNGRGWTGLTEPCVYMLRMGVKNVLPATFEPTGGVHSGQCVIFLTQTPSADEMTMIYLKSEDNSETFLNVSFLINEEVIKRRSKIGGVLDVKQTSLPYWPLTVGQDVNLTPCIEDTLFRMYIDNVEMFTHDRRQSSHTIARFKIRGFIVRTLIYREQFIT